MYWLLVLFFKLQNVSSRYLGHHYQTMQRLRHDNYLLPQDQLDCDTGGRMSLRQLQRIAAVRSAAAAPHQRRLGRSAYSGIARS